MFGFTYGLFNNEKISVITVELQSKNQTYNF